MSALADALEAAGLLSAIFRAVEPAFPEEGCGFVFERPDGVLVNVPTRNMAQRLHERDPDTYPRGGADWFEPNMKPWREAEREGWTARLIYHSHPSGDAYFSDDDHASAVFELDDGTVQERTPGVEHMVVGVRDGVAVAAKQFRFDAGSGRFVEVARFAADGSRRSA